MQEEQLLKKAKKRVGAIKGFYAHLATYVATIAFLFLMNFMDDPGEWWVVYPAAAWGLSIFIHYLAVFGFSAFRGNDWEEKALEREMAKLRRKNGLSSPYENEETLDLEADQLELKEKVKRDHNYDDQDLV